MEIKYRPEIDGLRAIAVGAVIFYHAQVTILGFKPFNGGFIGVDIFFVISGYLITSIILNEVLSTGFFSFSNFYQRRIRRILPVFLFIMLVSLPFSWIYLSPSSLIDFSKSIIYSLGFSSNFYFHYSGQQYGSLSGLYKPFLHTWSLSIEEQFYILFPIILFVIFKYFGKYLSHILAFFIIMSLGFADWSSRNYPSFNFYILPTRAWELLAGSIMAYFEIKLGLRNKYRMLNLTLPSVGLFLIIQSILFFNNEMRHPSFYTLFPIIGACLIIWFSHKDELVTKVLSSRLFVGVGLISYSLYLWHYPIFAAARMIEFTQGNLLKKLLLGVIVILLSIISYFLIERPARNKNNKFKIIISLILLSISILLIINLKFIQNDGYKNRFYSSEFYELDKSSYYKKDLNFQINYNYNNFDDRKNVLIVGNSHGENILEILSNSNLKNKIYFNLTSPKVRTSDYNFQLSSLYKFLSENFSLNNFSNNDLINHLKKQYDNADVLILSTKYSYEDLNILDDLIKILKKDRKKIIVFDNALEQSLKLGFNRLDYYVYKNKKFPEKNTLKIIEENMFLDLKNTEEINNKIELIAKKNNVFLIKREKVFCDFDEQRCPSITEEGYKIYYDHEHITNKGAVFFSRVIENNELFLKYLNSTLH